MSILLRASQVVQGSNQIIVDSGQIIIGRLPSNHLAIPGAEVEPIHAMIEFDENTSEPILVDMASEAGVQVNGKVIEVSTKIKPGDTIQIGKVRIEVLDSKQAEEEARLAAQRASTPPPPRATIVTDGVTSASGTKSTQTANENNARFNVTQKADSVLKQDVPTAGDAKKVSTARVSYGGIFQPGKERSVGSTLEIVAFWDQSILDVRHYGGRWEKGDQPRSNEVFLGNESDGHLIGIGPKADTRNYRFAQVSGSKSTIYLDKYMKARIRRGNQFERMQGPGKFSLANREIAIIKHGPVHYFLQNVSMPNPVLKRFEDIDGKPIIFWYAAILYVFLAVGIFMASRNAPDEVALDNDPWAQILTVRTPTPRPTALPAAKPPVELPKPTPPPITTPKPTPPPKKVEPVKVSTPSPTPVKSLEKPKVPQPQPVKSGVSKGEVKNARDKALGRKNNSSKSGNSGGARGGTAGAMAGQRAGNQKTDQMGVEKGKQNALSGINLDELGAGVGKVMDISAVGAIATGLKSSAGGAGAGSGSGAKGSHGFGGMGNQNSLSTGGPARALAGLGGGAGGLGSGGLGGSGGDGSMTRKIKAQAVAVPEGDPAVEGGLTKEEIEAVIRANLAQIKACYERNLQGDRGLAGRVKTDFTISTDGRVTSASISQSTLGSPATENCIASAIKRWKFPLPRGNSQVKVSYPFVFSSR